MMNKDQILAQAEKTLAVAKACGAYHYLQSVKEEVLQHKELAEKTLISPVLSDVSELEHAIAEGDYVVMSRIGCSDYAMFMALELCAERVEKGLIKYEKNKSDGFTHIWTKKPIK